MRLRRLLSPVKAALLVKAAYMRFSVIKVLEAGHFGVGDEQGTQVGCVEPR